MNAFEAGSSLDCDLLVIGGGINGAGIARDAAGRGLSVVLCEKDDLASHTSSSSTKLIHGGLRYLEHYEFGLVRKALIERERLLRSAPHIMWPLRFVMPHDPGMRPGWLIRLGLVLYDHLARREILPGSHGVSLHRHPAGAPLKPAFDRGYVYSDGWVDDARLVVMCARDAADRGARVLTRTECIEARRDGDGWRASLRAADGSSCSVRARAVVNAAGPWAASVLGARLGAPAQRNLRLVKGSHIVVRKLFDHPFAYIFQNSDKRIVFAIPYEGEFTLIGTTDIEHHGDPGKASASADEVAYLCELASHYFARPVRTGDVVWSYSGVRPLLDDASGDASKVTRDYSLELDADGAPLLSVWGGKITTFRKLAEEAVDTLASALGQARPAWTEHAVLPGGDLGSPAASPADPLSFEAFCASLRSAHAWLPERLARRLARAYGSRARRILAGARCRDDLGPVIAGDLHEAELSYLVSEEWARSADDVLWRRSKLGLHFSIAERDRVAQALARLISADDAVPA